MDTIYLIQNARIPDQYKIGITGNWAQRSRQLEVGTKTTCVTTARVNDPRSLEKHLHRRFSAERLPQSEWFHLSSSQLLFVQSAFRKAESDCQAAAVAVPELIAERQEAAAARQEAIRRAALHQRQPKYSAKELREMEAAYNRQLEEKEKEKAAQRERLREAYNKRPDVIKGRKVETAAGWGFAIAAAAMFFIGGNAIATGAERRDGPQAPFQEGMALIFAGILAVPAGVAGGFVSGIAASFLIKE